MIIQNDGQAIVRTDYWETEMARAGYFYLSWNAGAGRVLVPEAASGMLLEMRGAREVIVSRGPWVDQGGREALELMWEDDTDAPFALHLVTEQTDRLVPAEQQGGGFVIAVWTPEGKQGQWPGRYRIVKEIPCLQAWRAH